MRLGGARKAALIATAVCGQIALMGQATVPFVGCQSDGQVGPQEAPSGKAPALPISAVAAARLAYYKAAVAPGVLAPRGWHCLGVYGSGGAGLWLSPEPLDLDTRLTGAAIALVERGGDSSGRSDVAEVIARVFPSHKDFVARVIEMFPFLTFPEGPYREDRLTYKGQDVVEYETLAHADGLGTHSPLVKNGSPIRGVAMLTGSGDFPDLLLLSVRLPKGMEDLTAVIIQRVERETVPYRRTQDRVK